MGVKPCASIHSQGFWNARLGTAVHTLTLSHLHLPHVTSIHCYPQGLFKSPLQVGARHASAFCPGSCLCKLRYPATLLRLAAESESKIEIPVDLVTPVTWSHLLSLPTMYLLRASWIPPLMMA
jgi:hypothetical protein